MLITTEAIETGLNLAEAKAVLAEVEANITFDPIAAMMGTLPTELTEAINAVYAAEIAHNEAVAAQNKSLTVIDGVVTKVEECKRCGGHGHIPSYHYIANGVCFACNGNGRVVA